MGRFRRKLGVALVFTEWFLLLELAIVFTGGFLVLLVLGDQVGHVGLSLRKLHLVHAFAGVPVEESLATEHGCVEGKEWC